MSIKRLLQTTALVGSAVTLACSDGTGPAARAPSFSSEMTLPQFDEVLAQGPARLEIKLVPGGLVASEIEIKEPAVLSHEGKEEKIESHIAAIEATAEGGAVTLALGGLRVGFTAATRFEAENGGGDFTLGEFVDRVQAALAAGEQPAVEARRDPLAAPQDAGDPTFVADDLRLDDQADEPKMEINVAGDNRADCSALAAPPEGCIGALRVLGVGIAIVQGVTELESEMPDLADEADFEGMVQSVEPAAGSVTLTDGTVIRVVPGTRFEEADHDDELGSLADVAAALAAGRFVEAKGKGLLESEAPRTIVAVEIEFKVEDEPEDVPDEEKFEGLVTAVDVAAGTFTIAGGATVRLTPETEIEENGDLLTLEAVAAAVAAGQPVRAEGDAVRDAGGVLTAIEVKWEVDE